jgi:hypothetical protein
MPDGAYYLAGYAAECALKACIAKQTKKHDFPDKNTVNQSYTHDLTQLLKVGGLEASLDKAAKGDRHLEVNWTILKDWSEGSRYERRSQSEARDLLKAVADRQSGILTWLKRHW